MRKNRLQTPEILRQDTFGMIMWNLSNHWNTWYQRNTSNHFFNTLQTSMHVWFSAWKYTDSYRKEGDKINQLLKMASHVLFFFPSAKSESLLVLLRLCQSWYEWILQQRQENMYVARYTKLHCACSLAGEALHCQAGALITHQDMNQFSSVSWFMLGYLPADQRQVLGTGWTKVRRQVTQACQLWGQEGREFKQQGEHLCRGTSMVGRKQNTATKLQVAKKGNPKPKVSTLLRNTKHQTVSLSSWCLATHSPGFRPATFPVKKFSNKWLSAICTLARSW